jgi:lysozyme family protein
MTGVEIKAALDGAPEFIAYAVEQLAVSLGETDPAVVLGRRIMASLDAIPDGALLVTEETLAAAIHRAWPYRRNTGTRLVLSAASILAALRAEP